MCNTCLTDYLLEGKGKEETELVFNCFKQLLETKQSIDRDGKMFKTNPNWLGYILTDLLKIEIGDIHCRGTFEITEGISKTPHGYGFRLSTDTAWNACSRLFDLVRKAFSLNLFFLEIEPCGQIFNTNDKEGYAFPQKYWLDSDIEGEELFNSFDDFAHRFEEITGLYPFDFEQAECYAEMYEGDFLSIHRIEYTEHNKKSPCQCEGKGTLIMPDSQLGAIPVKQSDILTGLNTYLFMIQGS